MNDQTAQDPQVPTNSYVDEYTPPTNNSKLEDIPLDSSASSDSSAYNPISDLGDNAAKSDDTQAPKVDPMIVQDDDDNTSADDILSDEDFEGVTDKSVSDEDIEAQNIFVMLGVEAGDDELKEKFLDQLQDVIWDDFLGNDVELLLTDDELKEFKVFQEKADSATGDEQEKAKDDMVEYLEKLIPDLEDVMLEKALDLKADLFAERISGMKEYYSDKAEQLALVNQAETMMFEDKWKSSAKILNDIKE